MRISRWIMLATAVVIGLGANAWTQTPVVLSSDLKVLIAKTSAPPAVVSAWPVVSPTNTVVSATNTTAVTTASPRGEDVLTCANWIYAGSKSSVCFSPKFLTTVREATHLNADIQFTPIKLSAREIFDHPFAVMTGEGAFTLLEDERRNLKEFLSRGGFLLASAGCSSAEWARSFRTELAKIMPEVQLKPIPMDHAMFRTVYEIPAIKLRHGGTTTLQGLDMNGRIVLVYTSEGLNDTGNVKGCCCCGGNEIENSQEVNVNIFTYATMH